MQINTEGTDIGWFRWKLPKTEADIIARMPPELRDTIKEQFKLGVSAYLNTLLLAAASSEPLAVIGTIREEIGRSLQTLTRDELTRHGKQ